MSAAAPPVSTPLKLGYGAGAIAYGIKDNGFSVFLLMFYNQVVGLPASKVGAVIMAALVVDALIDPIIGALSDRTRSRWGRRHPWLYASALPIALSWWMIWHPPLTGEAQQLAFLFVAAIAVRLTLSCNELPSIAQLAELTSNYHERTAILRFRHLFGWLAGVGMLAYAYGALKLPQLRGVEARETYAFYGMVGAVLMLVSVLVSALSTHSRLAHPPARAIPPVPWSAMLRGIARTLGNRPFLTLLAAGMLVFTNQGLTFAITNYLLTFAWRLSAGDMVLYTVALIAGALTAFALVAPIGRRFGKPRTAALAFACAATIGASPYWLRLLGLYPEVGTPAALYGFLAAIAVGNFFAFVGMVTAGSMMADVVEASEERTGHREEGLFASGILFMQKTAPGLGIFISGLILSTAQFPAGAAPDAVLPQAVDRMIQLFTFATLSLALLSALIYRTFPFDGAEHAARVSRLAGQ